MRNPRGADRRDFVRRLTALAFVTVTCLPHTAASAAEPGTQAEPSLAETIDECEALLRGEEPRR